MPTLPPRTIYAITHREFSGLPHARQVERLLAAGATLIQLREKQDAGTERLEMEARRCAELCRAAGATLIVNDDARLCVLAGAHGVHLGQGDMEPARAREIVGPDRIIGLSTHNEKQFEEALRQPVDYIAVGPVFGTTTKENPDPAVGLEFVRWAARRLEGGRPLVAIGGITRHNLAQLLSAAPDVIPAVIGGIMKAPDIGKAFREMQEMMERNPKSQTTTPRE